MQHHSPVTSTSANTIRAAIAGFGLLVALAGLPMAAAGCGSATEPAPAAATPATLVQTVVTTETAQASEAGSTTPGDSAAPSGLVGLLEVAPPASLSLHDRVMAEQGRDAGSAPALDPSLPSTATVTTLAPVDLQQPPTTTPGLAVPDTSSPTAGAPATAPPSADAGSTTAVVLADGRTPLRGIWSGTAEQLATFLAGDVSMPRFTVPTLELAGYYVRYCAEAGLRADLLWAQMALETGYGAYGGDVSPYQNNFAGIGATGGGAAGASFATAEAGVMAQVAHMVAYVFAESPVQWANSTTDPRFDFVNPRGAAVVLADLNGRWAVPGESYGQHIEDIARRLNASVK
jgi:hypothetical protein